MKTVPSKIHPDLQAIAAKSPRFLFSHRNLGLMRWMTNVIPAPRPPEDIDIQNIYIPRPAEPTKIRLRVYRLKSANAPTPVLVWLHGGGYIMGRPEMDDFRCIQFVRAAGVSVVSVDYRYAPRYPFPSGLEDGYATLKWVTAQPQAIGADARRIAIGGASAGGGLAAALAQLAYDRQEIRLAFQLLVYPMLDDRTVLRTDLDDRDNFTWPRKNNQVGWEAYLGQKCGANNLPAYAVPARRTDLSGLPPAWIGVGSLDLFQAEDTAYAQRLREHGVECEILLMPGAFHGFDVLDPRLPIVQEFQNSQIRALKKYVSVH